MNTDVLWYKKPADNFNESLPLGNGRIGACLYGRVENETISLNEDTLWSGYPHSAIPDKDYPLIYDRIKSLVLSGEKAKAQKLAEEKFGDFLVQMYLPLGKMNISTDISGNISNYKRELHMDTGVHKLSYSIGDCDFTRETFISEPAQVMVTKIESSKKNFVNFTLSLESDLQVTHGTDNKSIYFTGNAPVCTAEYGTSYNTPEKQTYPADESIMGVGFCAAASVKVKGGVVSVNNNKICVKNADEALICFAARTSFKGWDKPYPQQNKSFKEQCFKDLAVFEKRNYSELFCEHISCQQALYNKCGFKLETDEKKEIPTDALIKKHSAGEKSKSLYMLLFNYGKYLLTATSRKNTQPSNLQGIWNEKLMPPWNCNYTLNINTEMNYWTALPLGMFECYEPFVKMVEELAKAGTETAQSFYGADGWVCHHSTDIWRLTHPGTNRLNNNAQWGFWNMASGWLSVMLWNYYIYIGDKEYLRRIYPIIEGAARFYAQLLSEKDGFLILCPSTSPENNYIENKEKLVLDTSTAMSQEIMYDLFMSVAEAQKALGLNDTFSHLVKKLKMPKIRKDGALCEWDEEHEVWDEHHRHISHLYGLFPGDLFDDTKKAAAENTLVSRGDGGTGWSLAWKINAWARLGEGEQAFKLLDRQLTPVESDCESTTVSGGTYPNLFCAHPPFQIDGNFGACSGIINMLLQVHGDNISLLPALPKEWSDGEVFGLQIHGNKSISFKWRNGKLTEKNVIQNKENKLG